MNHLAVTPLDYDEPLISDAIAVDLNAKGAHVCSSHSPAISINVSSDGINFSITETLTKPLVVAIRSESKIRLSIEPHVSAHVVIDAKKSFSLETQIRSHASLSLYYVSHNSDSQIFEESLVEVEANAKLRVYELSILDDKTVRNLTFLLIGDGAKGSYFGIDQLNGHAKKISTLKIHHGAANTSSTQMFRGIYADFAHGTFLGKVVVEKEASLSSVRQLYKSIILNDGAKAHVMPQLEINNYNISASHGASIGELDEQMLFYLCSRGLSLKEAKAILIRSFLGSILDGIDDVLIRNALTKKLLRSIELSVASRELL